MEAPLGKSLFGNDQRFYFPQVRPDATIYKPINMKAFTIQYLPTFLPIGVCSSPQKVVRFLKRIVEDKDLPEGKYTQMLGAFANGEKNVIIKLLNGHSITITAFEVDTNN